MMKIHISTIFALSLTMLTACNALQKGAVHTDDIQAVAGQPANVATTLTTAATESSNTTNTTDTTNTADSEKIQNIEEKSSNADIWNRIRQGFRLPDYDHKRVAVELKWFANHQEYLDRVAVRADPFLYLIVEEIERRGMPMEIALLPIIESAFQPFAYSHGRAAGIWQFIPGTGRRYGLKQNWWYDGRRDIPAATNAALDYLQYLHKHFDGDWLHALAAYNSGEGRVKSAIRKNRRKGKPVDFWNLKLPRETRGYVPKLLAISSLIATPEKYGVQLKTISDTSKVASVETGTQIDLAMAAKIAGISLEEMYHLNPAFNRWATDPNGPHQLLLPIENVQGFQEKLAVLPEDKRIQWKRHKIRNGESLGLIAKRYGTTVSLLKKTNRIRGSRIRAGRHLIIPVSTRSLASYTLSSEQRQKSIQRKTNGSGKKITHTVRKGDNLWDISRKYKVSVTRLAKWNGIAPRDMLKLGQKLVVWVKNAASATASAIRELNITGPDRTTKVNYVVRRGDSLSRISNKFRVTIRQLRKWNRLKSKYLQPGQRITVYVDITRQS